MTTERIVRTREMKKKGAFSRTSVFHLTRRASCPKKSQSRRSRTAGSITAMDLERAASTNRRSDVTYRRLPRDVPLADEYSMYEMTLGRRKKAQSRSFRSDTHETDSALRGCIAKRMAAIDMPISAEERAPGAEAEDRARLE